MKYFSYVYDAFRRVSGYPLSFLSFLLTIFTWHFRSRDSIPLWVATLVGVLLLIALITFADALGEALRRKAQLPAVRRALSSVNLGYDSNTVTLLIEPSDLFSVDSRISVYGLVQDFEVLIGYGRVATINDKKLIQAIIYKYPEGVHVELWNRILANDKDVLPTIRIKPTVPLDVPQL